MPAGRPKKQLSDLPDKWYDTTLALYSVGASDVEIRAELSIAQSTWERMLKEEEEFSITIKKGRQLSNAWWERQGRTNLKETKFSATLWYMNMKNRFHWADKQEIQHGVDDKLARIIAKGDELSKKYEKIILEEEANGPD